MISDYTHSAPPACSTHAGLQQAGLSTRSLGGGKCFWELLFLFPIWVVAIQTPFGEKTVQLCIYKICPFLCFIFLEVKRQKAACKISCDIKLDGISRQVKKLITAVLRSVPRTS